VVVFFLNVEMGERAYVESAPTRDAGCIFHFFIVLRLISIERIRIECSVRYDMVL
jgi:hypothetical protein